MQDMERLYLEHAKTVYRYIVSLCRDPALAEDITQETFCRALRCIHTYNGACKVSVWLCQIAKHIWYQELEKRKKGRPEPLDSEILSTEETPEKAILSSEERLLFFKALHRLEESVREVVYLRLTGEFSFREIGEILGREESWARVAFYRAKQRIMKGMNEDEM